MAALISPATKLELFSGKWRRKGLLVPTLFQGTIPLALRPIPLSSLVVYNLNKGNIWDPNQRGGLCISMRLWTWYIYLSVKPIGHGASSKWITHWRAWMKGEARESRQLEVGYQDWPKMFRLKEGTRTRTSKPRIEMYWQVAGTTSLSFSLSFCLCHRKQDQPHGNWCVGECQTQP